MLIYGKRKNGEILSAGIGMVQPSAHAVAVLGDAAYDRSYHSAGTNTAE